MARACSRTISVYPWLLDTSSSGFVDPHSPLLVDGQAVPWLPVTTWNDPLVVHDLKDIFSVGTGPASAYLLREIQVPCTTVVDRYYGVDDDLTAFLKLLANAASFLRTDEYQFLVGFLKTQEPFQQRFPDNKSFIPTYHSLKILPLHSACVSPVSRPVPKPRRLRC